MVCINMQGFVGELTIAFDVLTDKKKKRSTLISLQHKLMLFAVIR